MSSPDDPRRPVTVIAAAGTTIAVAITYLIACALTFTALQKVIGATGDEYEQFDAGERGTITTIKATMVVSIVVYLAITIALLVLAVGNLRGRKGARVGTWVLAGLFLLCALCGSIGNGSATAGFIDQDPNKVLVAGDLYPSWYTPGTIALDVVLTVLYAVLITLLALPASNRFFKVERLPPRINA
jgi:hypothetical protein